MFSELKRRPCICGVSVCAVVQSSWRIEQHNGLGFKSDWNLAAISQPSDALMTH